MTRAFSFIKLTRVDLESKSWTHFHWQAMHLLGCKSQVLKAYSFLALCKERSILVASHRFWRHILSSCSAKKDPILVASLQASVWWSQRLPLVACFTSILTIWLATHVLLEWCTDDVLIGPAIIRKIHLLFSRTQKHLSPCWYLFDVIKCVELDWQLNCATFSNAAKLHFNYPLLLLGLDIAIAFYELILISTYISELIFNLPKFCPRI